MINTLDEVGLFKIHTLKCYSFYSGVILYMLHFKMLYFKFSCVANSARIIKMHVKYFVYMLFILPWRTIVYHMCSALLFMLLA